MEHPASSPRRPAARRLVALVLFAQAAAVQAQTCSGALPDPRAPQADPTEKFSLIARQCNVLAEPERVQRSPVLGLYDRGASVTVRMTDEPAATTAAPAASAPVVRNAAPLGRDGRRVLALAPALTAAALAHGVDPLLMHAIAHVESRHDDKAVSPAGARGVMQVMPATGRRFGAGDAASLFDAETNLRASAAYLRTLLRRYDGDLTRVLAAYNAGEGAVDKHRGVPPYAETQAYVRDVLAIHRRLTQEFGVTASGELVAKGS